jgi:hypothetical protein
MVPQYTTLSEMKERLKVPAVKPMIPQFTSVAEMKAKMEKAKQLTEFKVNVMKNEVKDLQEDVANAAKDAKDAINSGDSQKIKDASAEASAVSSEASHTLEQAVKVIEKQADDIAAAGGDPSQLEAQIPILEAAAAETEKFEDALDADPSNPGLLANVVDNFKYVGGILVQAAGIAAAGVIPVLVAGMMNKGGDGVPLNFSIRRKRGKRRSRKSKSPKRSRRSRKSKSPKRSRRSRKSKSPKRSRRSRKSKSPKRSRRSRK